MARMTAYSMIAAKMLRMQVTMKVSMALRLVEDEEGEFALPQAGIILYSKHLIDLLCCIESINDDKEQDDKQRHPPRDHLMFVVL